MASKFAQQNPMEAIKKVEQLINSTFEEIIGAATKRRDQLLAQLLDLKQDYLNKEQDRQKQVEGLENYIKQINEICIQQNRILSLQEEQKKSWEEEKKKYIVPTPLPNPSFYTEGLDSLLEQVEKFGSILDLTYRNKTEPVRRIGKRGSENGELNFPLGIALEGENIYVADTENSRIQIFSTEGKFIQEFGKGQLDHPRDIKLCNEWVFVSDWGLNAVIKFSKTNYKLIKSVKGVVSYPYGLTTDTNGEVLVADSNNNRIAIFSSDLEYIREIGKGKLISPCDVKINNNNIFVADKNEINNIHIFSESGDWLKSLIQLEVETFICMCFDLCNNILISDNLGNSIQIFTKDGQLIHKIQCKNPTGIVVDINFNIICASYDNVINIY